MKEQLLENTRETTSFYPLSYGQQALWFLYDIAPSSVAYNIFTTVKIGSNLDILALRRIWQKIVTRHPILRTTYTNYSDRPVQKIHEQPEIPIKVTDASNWSEDYLNKQILLETDRSFNLEKDSVLRVNLFTRSAQEHFLLLTTHHIAGDLWSFDLLLHEFQLLYAAETKQAISQQIEVAEDFLAKNLPYTEFVGWQSSMLSSSRGEELWKYWQKQLAGELPVLNLPTDRPRPPVQTYRGETHIFKLDEKLIQELKNLALTSGTSLYRILLAAFFVLLYRYTNQEDILVGSPMAGRWGQEEFKEIVGYLVNPVVLRASVSGNLTFKDFLAQVSSQVKEAQKHQDYPFSLLVKQLQPQRDPSRSPLFQVSFTWQKQRWCHPAKNSSYSLGKELQMEPYPLGHQRGAGFDLDVMVMEVGEVIQVCWQYNTDLFDVDTIARMAGHFQTLLLAIAANPEQQISELPLLTETERYQLLFEWNNTQAEYPQNKCIHQLFEEQVERSPNAVAVVFESEQLTYQELNVRANQLAHYLKTLGVKPEVLVGICVERSLEMVVGLLGILKAGGAYVPLDPAYPLERLAFMLEDASVPVLLTQAQQLDKLPQHSACVVCLDRDWSEIALLSEENSMSEVAPDTLAYVIYTSGSTGKPKGALLAHQGLCNLATAQIGLFDVQPDSRILQFASFSFDASVSEIFMALATGATLVLARRDSLMPGVALVELLRDYSITTVILPPSVLEVMPREKLPALRTIIVAGEVCPPNLVARWASGHQFFNAYGPTEATVCTTVALCSDAHQKPPIGHPIANMQVYLLDEKLHPIPINVPGEMYIGGVGLARGYLNRPDLTHEKFIPNPFSNKPGETRLYKTGDKARYMSDGNIEFLGRIDNQVKVRGFRIELGEVEVVLCQYPGVRETVVIARKDTPSHKYLAAYIVSEQPLISKDLRNFLKQKLPDYMIPAAFIMLDALPLTRNGKIDRRALPAPDASTLSRETAFIPPRTPTEKILATIWAEVLQLEQVGIQDNFFELGGDSILSIQIVARCNTVGLKLIPKDLFGHQTIASLAQVVSNSGEIQAKQGIVTGTVPLTLAPPLDIKLETQIESIYPLSPMQEGMLFHSLYAPDSGVYFVQSVFTLYGKVNVSAFERAWVKVVEAYSVLRTLFVWKDRQHPLQIVCKSVNLPWNNYDWRLLSPVGQQERLNDFLQTERNRGFELDKAPLMRCTLVQVADNTYQFVWSFHHLLMDGWSLPIVLKQVFAFYEAFKRDDNLYLDVPIPYQNYIAWLREQDLYLAEKFWRQTLSGFTAPTPMVVDKSMGNPSNLKQTYDQQYLNLSPTLTDALKSYVRQHHLTLNTLVQGAWALLLSRYSGEYDVVFGATVSGRPPTLSGVESMVGLFINTLPVRVQVPSDTELLPWLKQLQTQQVELLQYSYSPLVEIQGISDVPRNLPLFESIVVFENYPENSSLLQSKGSIEISNIRIFERTNYPLTAIVVPGLELSFQISYDTSRFYACTVKRMIGHLQTIFEGITANPQQPISKLPLLTEQERHQLLVEWNCTTTEYTQSKCIHQLFEVQVEQNPEEIAVVFENQQLTYRELNCRANQLAHYLQSLGVKPEVLVGICVERSLEMVVGLLGILKAGGAYVPLDPTYPDERLVFMLEDSQARVLLTQQQMVESLALHKASTICLDSDWEVIEKHSNENLSCRITSHNLAYVIYTSGSTGKPKGVAMSHHSLSNLIEWQLENSTLPKGAKTLQFSPISFDVSFQEIFSTWCSGGTLVLISDEVRRDPLQLWRFLTNQAIKRIFLPFVALQQLAEVADTQKTFPISLREIITAGEQLLISRQIKNLFTKLNNCTLQNQYGPSESHVVTAFTLTASPSYWSAFPPIGRPIRNTQIYILDAQLQPVPIGVPGELYIGGVALAQGYINRPDLTAEKFIPNPFSNKSGERLYKTGDRARYLPDGNIEFINRIDNQVKIRGFRIELGEIEAILAQHPDVIQAVVVAQKDIPDNKHLVAYVVFALGYLMETQDSWKALQRTVTRNLRNYLKQKLPDYMVPSGFVLMRALPLTPNGKVDRCALKTLGNWDTELEDNFVAPSAPTEEILAAIWTEVLGVQQVGVNDNFFELGGHSLLGTQIISRIRSAFSIELPLRYLFEAPTIAFLAQVIETAQKEKLQEQSEDSTKFDTLPPLVPIARDTHIPMSFSQQMVWDLQQLHIDSCAYNSSIILCLNGSLREEELEKSINEIIRRHEILRTTFAIVKEQPVQVIAPSLTLPLNVIDLQHLLQKEREVEAVRLANQEVQHHFDLASSPLIKITLLRLEPQKHWLIITMHHIITDGWSYSILLQELGTLYQAFSNGLPSPLPEVTIQYADFTLWQQKYLNEEALEKQRSYWLQKLANVPPKLDLLPSFQPQSNSNSKRTKSYSIVLPSDQVASMEDLSRLERVTTFAIILAALKILLYKLSGQTDIIILATTANRSTPEIEKMFGCFINDVFLRDKIDISQAIITFLKQVNQTICEALANQDMTEKSIKTISDLEFIRTINVSMAPPIRWNSKMLDCEVVVSNCLEHELWDEQSSPLELYIYSQNEDSTTIEIIGCYSTDCFTDESIERLFSDYQEILKQLVQYPKTVLSEFLFLPYK